MVYMMAMFISRLYSGSSACWRRSASSSGV
jgi:hypothetical protein